MSKAKLPAKPDKAGLQLIIRHMAQAAGKTLADVSRELGHARNYLSVVLKDATTPGLDLFVKIANACGYDVLVVGHGEAHRLAAETIGDAKVSATRLWSVEDTLGKEVTGETSDGYHTFDELYHHRAVLFSVVVRDHAELAWKSKRHHDGTMYDNMFIVGIETPTGQATYHYDIDPYWEMFDCKELEQAPEWDGHTPADAIARIATLGRGECHDTEESRWFHCSECGFGMFDLYTDGDWYDEEQPKFCPNCGRRVVGRRYLEVGE